jgi:hypothetical protein
MKSKQFLWLSLLTIGCGVPLYFLLHSKTDGLPFWVGLIAIAILGGIAHSFILRQEGYVDELRRHVASHGFEVVSSRALPWFSTGSFPLVRFEVRPYVSSQTAIGSREFTQYRRVVLRDAHGRRFRTCARLEFNSLRCVRVEFKPDLGSLLGKRNRQDERKKRKKRR